MSNYIVRTLTEDGELESPDIEYDIEEDAHEGFDTKVMYTFDTESLFYPGDPFWIVQLINAETGDVLAETNSFYQAKGFGE